MNKTKKILLATMAVCLIAALSVGGTLAYLKVTTDTKTNQFSFVGTGAGGLNAVLEEPLWEVLPDTDSNGIPDEAENLVPGRVVSKDPTVTNEGVVSEYVALKVQFTKADNTAYTDAEVATILDNITLDWNTTDWTRYNSSTATSAAQYFYYNSSLAVAASTATLFNTFTVDADADVSVLNTLKADGLNIVITGQAIQAEGFASATAASAQLTFA